MSDELNDGSDEFGVRHMLLSEAISSLQELLKTHGDIELVTGLRRSGYGESVIDFEVRNEGLDINGVARPVVDIILNDESLVAIGGF